MRNILREEEKKKKKKNKNKSAFKTKTTMGMFGLYHLPRDYQNVRCRTALKRINFCMLCVPPRPEI